MSISQKEIKNFREIKGFTQQQLASILGISIGTVRRWESEKGAEPSGTAAMILRALIDAEFRESNANNLTNGQLASRSVYQLLSAIYENHTTETKRGGNKMGHLSELREILEKATTDEVKAFGKIFDIKEKSVSVDKIINEVIFASTNIFESFKMGWNEEFGKFMQYREVVCKVADYMNVSYDERRTTEEIEVFIAQNAFESIWEKMDEEQRKDFEEELKRQAEKFAQDDGKTINAIAHGGVLAAMTAAKMSGFGIFLLATTSLGAVTHAIGITLPFVVFTTMTKSISIILGPLGWAALGISAFLNITGKYYKSLVSAILLTAALRAKQKNNLINI